MMFLISFGFSSSTTTMGLVWVSGAEDALLAEELLAPPAFMNTFCGPLFGRSVARLASSAARSAMSIVSPQCLHFNAAALTDSPQNGHDLESAS
jgi:hypothetical protein